MSDLKEIQKYWNSYINDIEVAENEIGSKEFFEELARYRYERFPYLLKILSFNGFKNKQILEIGCGIGLDTSQLSKRGGILTAIDLTPNAVKLAKQNFKLNKLRGNFLLNSAETLGFNDESFDVVYSHGVIHHTANIINAVEEIYRVLKEGGEAIVMIYNKYSWLYLLSLISGTNIEHAEEDAPVINVYSKRGAKKLFRKFSDVTVTVERPPVKTKKYGSIKGFLFNHIFVPVYNSAPTKISKNFGWHIMIRAIK
ncbi:MAG: class I SAM-dependent methyltransferase [Candidatus Hodarchaeales archaeon]|jgi:2-polyprenyl-3-methyl-5-hydroxy-6-metoxy-1,4-benzoquinol methylase